MHQSTCAVDGCEREAKRTGLCGMHYLRRYKTGETGPAAPLSELPMPLCGTPGCETVSRSRHIGLCEMHYGRMRRNGNLNGPIPGTTFAPGAEHRNWVGSEVTYRTAHNRVAMARGKASEYPCIDCGAPARHWSYDGLDPEEKREPGLGTPYSADIEHYAPRCVPCHWQHDHGSAVA